MEKGERLLEALNSCSIYDFLEEKLKRYLKRLAKLERSNLYDAVISEVEKALISIILKETEGNQLRAAKALGINRNTLRSKIKEYKIKL
jgi:DNA-binding protein Fis